MGIKEYLKQVGITQKELAEKLGLSRPTLDSYIAMYESNTQIPKERYKIIFERLFGEGTKSNGEFINVLNQMEALLSRDKNYGISDLEPIAADYISLALRNMKKDVSKEGWNRDVYTFINYVVLNYRNNELIEQLVEYFIFLNDMRRISSIQDYQKPYFANIYKTFKGLGERPDLYDEQDFRDFVKRCKEIQSKKQRNTENQSKRIKNRIEALVNDYKEKGVELSEEEIITEISNQMIMEKNQTNRDSK